MRYYQWRKKMNGSSRLCIKFPFLLITTSFYRVCFLFDVVLNVWCLHSNAINRSIFAVRHMHTKFCSISIHTHIHIHSHSHIQSSLDYKNYIKVISMPLITYVQKHNTHSLAYTHTHRHKMWMSEQGTHKRCRVIFLAIFQGFSDCCCCCWYYFQ